jgi:3-oxoacyl-[acyl-carrier-protein] synthase-3
MYYSSIAAIEYFLPERTLTTVDLSTMFPEWSVEKIDKKTGINTRHVARDDECASDLAFAAAQKLFASGAIDPSEIDFVLFCTQSPDYILPTTACLLQDRLNIPRSAGCLDYNLGCSGFVYGLGLADGLIASQQARRILLLTADTYSKYLDSNDKNARTIFGDAAAATLIVAANLESPRIGPFVYGTDGKGGRHLILPNSGARHDRCSESSPSTSRRPQHLSMNGPEIFAFALETVPASVSALLAKAGLSKEDVDLFVFHQANAYLLRELRHVLDLPEGKIPITLSHCGNTVSSTIPIALKHAELDGRLRSGAIVMVVGFGVGYSWAAAIIWWTGLHQ